ncbi:MAG: hypothetical protein GTN40_03460 [Candidatus Aenigmarchaeota archaeon]|nr:hypothetical protein [Candidatus Aenigmarchaeota archaeon]
MKKKQWIVGIIVIVIILLLFAFPFWLYCCPDAPIDGPGPKAIACAELVESDCEKPTNSILVKDFDANKDNKTDSADTLFELCKNYYGGETESDCKKLCGCSLCSQDDPSLCDRSCESDNDCKLTCGCECVSENEECKYTGILCEAPDPNYACKCVNKFCRFEKIL